MEPGASSDHRHPGRVLRATRTPSATRHGHANCDSPRRRSGVVVRTGRRADRSNADCHLQRRARRLSRDAVGRRRRRRAHDRRARPQRRLVGRRRVGQRSRRQRRTGAACDQQAARRRPSGAGVVAAHSQWRRSRGRIRDLDDVGPRAQVGANDAGRGGQTGTDRRPHRPTARRRRPSCQPQRCARRPALQRPPIGARHC